MIKILHTADLHLDSPLSSNAAYPVKKQDLRDVFYNIITLATSEKVDIVLISGDLFDNEAVTIQTRKLVIDYLSKAAHIKFFIISGNHDYYKVGSVYENAVFPSNVTLFNKGIIEKVEISELNTVVYGLGLNAGDGTNRLLDGFNVEDASKINLMLFHGNLVSSNANANYFPISVSEIERSKLDYLALGHIHKASTPQKTGNTYYAYCGIPQGRGFDELDEKGVIIAEIAKEIKSFKFVKTCKKTFVINEIDISKLTTIYDVIDAVKKATSENNVIYRIVLIGQIPHTLHIDKQAIVSSLAAENNEYIEVIDSTTIQEDVKLLINETTLKGLFIKNITLEKHDEKDNSIYEDAIRIGLDALLK